MWKDAEMTLGKREGHLTLGPTLLVATCTSALPMVYAVVIKTISCQAYTSLSWFLFVFKASCLMHMVTTWVWAFSIMVNLLFVFPVLALGALSLQPTGVASGALFLLCDPVPLARLPCPRVMPSSISFISSSEGLDLRESCWELGSVQRHSTGRGRHMWGLVVQFHLCWIPRATPSFQNILPSPLPLQLAVTDLLCKPREHEIIH